MRARLQIVRNNKVTWDQIWKNRKIFKKMAGHGCRADKIRLDIELESAADVVALIDWCNMSYLCFKK
jgi:hypothetical protein